MHLGLITYFVLPILVIDRIQLVTSQPFSTVTLIDRKYENEPYFYDLSFVNSNYDSAAINQNKFATRDRSGNSSTKHSCQKIRPVPSSLRADLKLSYFYQRFTEAYGIPIVGSNKVSNNAMRRACYVLRFFLADRNDLKETFYKRNVRIVVMAITETLINLPEYSGMPTSVWNSVRGLSATRNVPLITVSDENVQCSNDKFKLEDMLVHELAYSVVSLNSLNEQQRRRLEYYYEGAKNTVPWSQTFALADIKEYFASGVEIYLSAKKEQIRFSYDELRSNDPGLYNLISEIFSCDNQFLNKCKTTREQEDSQALRIGGECELEAPMASPTTTTRASSTTTNTARNEYYLRQQQQNLPAHTTVRTTTAQSYQTLAKTKASTTTTTPSTTTTTTTTTTSTSTLASDCVNLNTMCDSWARKGECTRNRHFMATECPRSCSWCADQTTTRSSRRFGPTTTKIDLSIFAGLCKDEFTHCPVFALRGDCKLNPHYMLQKCKRSCNLCGDLVDQKDRIQPTSKKPASVRRPPSSSGGGSRPTANSEYNEFQNYYHSMIGDETTPSISTSTRGQEPISTSPTSQQEEAPAEENNNSNNTQQQSSDDPNSCKDLVGHCGQLAERGDCVSNEATMRYYCSKSCRFC